MELASLKRSRVKGHHVFVRKTPRSTEVKKTKKRRLNYLSYCLLFIVLLLR